MTAPDTPLNSPLTDTDTTSLVEALPSLGMLAAQVRALEARFAAAEPGPASVEQQLSLKNALVSLYHSVEQSDRIARELTQRMRSLAKEWKSRSATTKAASAASAAESVASPATAASAVSAAPTELTPTWRDASGRADHLGASTFVEKGWSRLAVGDAAGAEEALQRALTLAANNAEAEALLAWAQMLQGKLEDARSSCARVLEREPAHALSHANMGYISLREKQYGEAIEQLSHAIRLDSDTKATLYAHLYLGQVYYEREMYDDACAFFREAIARGPNLLHAYFDLGRAQWFSGDRASARATWRDGAAANKFNPWGKRCAEQLAAVESGVEPSRAL